MPRRLRRLPRQLQPDGVRLEYFKAIRSPAQAMVAVVRRDLVPELVQILEPVRADAIDDDRKRAQARAKKVMDGIARDLARTVDVSEIRALAKKFGERTSQFQRAQLGRQVRAAISVDINKIAATEKGIRASIDGWIAVNVDLIKTMPDVYFDDVRQQVSAAIERGTRHEVLAQQLAGRYEIPINRAALIARDQVGKLYGQLNAQRQQNLGIRKFIWRDAGDNRVREEHADLNGQTFPYDDPPAEGMPGEPISCRCYADPDLSEIFNLVDSR